MSSTTRTCKFHRDTIQSFCTNHGIYCCPTCHKELYKDCSVLSEYEARNYFQKTAQASASKIEGVMHDCQMLVASLQNHHDEVHRQNDTAIDCMVTFYDQIQSAVETSRRECIEKIRTLTVEKSDDIEKQLKKCEELGEFVGDLKQKVDADVKTHPENEDNTVKCLQEPLDLAKLNLRSVELRDGLTSAEIKLNAYNREDQHFTIPTQNDSNIIQGLSDKLRVMCESIGKSQERHEGSSVVNGLATAERDVRAEGACADVIAHPLSLVVPRSFRKVSEFIHWGTDRVVRLARWPGGLHILIASMGPSKLTLVDMDGMKLVVERTKAAIYDFCIRDDEVFAAAARDHVILVYNLGTLRFVRQIATIGKCSSIISVDKDLVVIFHFSDNKRASRMTETGCVTHTSSYKFKHPVAIVATSTGGKILVSDSGSIVVLAAGDMSVITKVTHPEVNDPHGLCVAGEHVLAACAGSDTVVELDGCGGYSRTVLRKHDGIVEPYELSYDSPSTNLVVSSLSNSEKILVLSGV